MFFSKKQSDFHFLYGLLFRVVVTAMPLVLSAQAAALELHKTWPLPDQSPAWVDAQRKVFAEKYPLQRSGISMQPMAKSNSGILTHRLVVECSSEFQDRKLEAMRRHFNQLFERDLAFANGPAEKIHSGFLNRVVLATSGLPGRKGFWEAHLQKSDFAMLADNLSLNDINRFQFRKNRKDGDLLPVVSAGETPASSIIKQK